MSLSRRRCLTGALLSPLACCLASISRAAEAPTARHLPKLTPDEVLQRLKEGNRRFRTGLPASIDTSTARRLDLAQGQAPMAAVLSCSDSRVPPEIVFSCGLGELFTVRNAGHTLDAAALGSLEYAIAALGTPLVVVLGHEKCGAVTAALELAESSRELPGHMGEMIEPIVPAALQALGQGLAQERLDVAVRAHTSRTVQRLVAECAQRFGPRVKEGSLRIVGARYDLEDGQVDFIV